MKSQYLILLLFYLAVSCKSGEQGSTENIATSLPNFLFCIADDWSYPHAGAYGDEIVKTPNFDRIAREGILFNNAFTASPSCAPSRASILTGQEMWRLEEGGLLFGALSNKYPVYTHLLKDHGYHIGYTGKGYRPADLERGGWSENPAGPAYQDIELDAPKGIRVTDYAANFEKFINELDGSKPFSFWYGASEPHRMYDYGIGAKNDYDLRQIKVPEFLPDSEETRNDVADYYFEVEWFDTHLGEMLKLLEAKGILDNTVIVVTSDNGMPFPRAKSNLYNYGDQMPLAIRYGNAKPTSRIVDKLVSSTDFAPTFLEMAGIDIPNDMTGKSLAPLITGQVKETTRDFVATGLERHTIARPEMKGYPMRAIHTQQYTYIHNFEPARWPMGNPDFDAWPQGFYGDVDAGASKSYLLEHSKLGERLFDLSLAKRPKEELYDDRNDPFQLNNLAEAENYKAIKARLKKQLFDYLSTTNDPRMKGLSPWDDYPYAGGEAWADRAWEK